MLPFSGMNCPKARGEYTRLLIFVWTCFVVRLCASAHPSPCDKTRLILTDASGNITNGPPGTNYTQDSHCEWLIKAQNASQFITLRFLSMGTECSYDYVFVYDGYSFDAPLLGSFSGKTEPQKITATSGYMLILLYSDTNYVLEGFQAEYTVNNCWDACGGRGVCVSHTCVCDGEFGGQDCSLELCPQACNHNGQCRGGKCHCNYGFSGDACTLDVTDKTGNSWHWLSRSESGLTPRTAHSAVYVNITDSLYVFGGYDLNNVLESLQIYRFASSQWEDEDGNVIQGFLSNDEVDQSILRAVLSQDNLDTRRWGLKKQGSIFEQVLFSSLHKHDNMGVLSPGRSTPFAEKLISSEKFEGSAEKNETYERKSPKPNARYGHSACRVFEGFAMYGGQLANGSLSSELWVYDVLQKKWSLRGLESAFKPPALTRHSLTAVNDELYLFGGSTEDGDFSSRMFRIKFGENDNNYWEEVPVRGGKQLDVRVVSHTTVYHHYSHSLLVYGGIAAGVARFSKLSDRMFEFDLQNRHWAEIHYPRGNNRDTFVPRERAFHTATIIGNYIMVFGGYSHRHNREEICYDSGLYLYHLGCHSWVPLSVLGLPVESKGYFSKYPKKQGIFAHAAALRPPSTLLLIGGYHGNVNGDLIAYVVPPWLGGINGGDPEAACPRRRSHSECLADPECGWCSADEICYGRTVGSNCTTNLQSVRCGGICPAMGDCHSCLIHGSQTRSFDPPRSLPSVTSKLGLHFCNWCVQSAVCHQKDDNYGSCGEETPSGGEGWWGAGGADLSRADSCARRDRRPGLTLLRYLPPADLRRPDGVAALNSTLAEWPSDGGGARMLGWLRLPAAAAGDALRLCANRARAELRLGDRSVARVDAPAKGFCGAAALPDPLPARLRLDLRAENASLAASPHHRSFVELLYNKSHESSKAFTFEHLEPYSNGSCETYDNCLMCVADSACGWCEATDRCESRDADERTSCTVGASAIAGSGETDALWRYLTLQPASCPNCSNHIGCRACAAAGCEWAGDEARCGRVGRNADAVRSPDRCPPSCRERASCADCLAPRERCVWCEATRQCFGFSVYTSEYQFGRCREWIDRAGYAPPQASVASPLGPLGAPDAPPDEIEQCESCSRSVECPACLRSLGCGWCYSGENPIRGACAGGDFLEPRANCASLLNVSASDALWAYAQCPDVDECGLGLHDCHEEAVCTNTHGSYSCKCLRGFVGDGRTSCARTCFDNCVHGYCVGPPDYACQCDLGWTGADCSENCGCHNHSTCRSSVGLCDECQDWTEGEYCESCKQGSYGNATTSRGCRRCDCNGHGNPDLGVCDSETGLCFCRDNTEGPTCERCARDFYGDPKHGGRCYYHCEARGMLSGVSEQGIGSHKVHSSPWGGPPAKECLWIISPGDSAERGIIQFSVNSSQLNVSCDNNAVYAFDGLPDLAGVQQSQLIGVFCNDASPGTVEAKSGHLTVHYKQGPPGEGFEGVYKVISCEKGCPYPRECKNDHCVCPSGFAGPSCNRELCPNNCTASSNRGSCDKGYGRCLCAPGWGGEDCSIKILPHQLVFTNLFDSDYLADYQDHLRKTLPRFGHSLVADRRGSIWMFGGYSLSHGPLNDIRLFDTRNNTWMQVTVEATPDAKMPEGRYFHAAEILHSRQIIYIYGGLSIQDGNNTSKTLGDFWQFGLKDQRWGVVPEDEDRPPPLAGHTLTLQKNHDSESLILIGGFSPERGFLSSVWEFDAESNKWKRLKTQGPKPTGIYGHTTVFHAPTQSFYVFGGYLYSPNGTHISNKLFSLHYPTLSWNELPPFPEFNGPEDDLPRARFLHSAATTDEYMIVFGGKTEPYNTTDSLIAYVYKCNQWIRLMQDADIVGAPPPATVAQAMTLDAESGALLVVGGWRGAARCRVTRAALPPDLCRLWSGGKRACRLRAGCSYCAVVAAGAPAAALAAPGRSPSEAARCFSAAAAAPADPCANRNGTLITNNGAACDVALVNRRDCSQFDSCAACVPVWPSHPDAEHVCHWCLGCERGFCAPFNSNCMDYAPECEEPFTAISHVDACPGNACNVADCAECTGDDCTWTRRVRFQANGPSAVDAEPIFNWGCAHKKELGRTGSRGECPARCHERRSCRACLRADGGEGGAASCRWAVQLERCVAPAHAALLCAGGVCGRVLAPGDDERCPAPCASFARCSDCLRRAHCGWCSRDGADGDGVCAEGSLDSPADRPALSACDVLYAARADAPAAADAAAANATFSWNYVRCPPEDECANGHDSCDADSERCVDLADGFECACGAGYAAGGAGCAPVCSQGCVRGTCVRPDVCDCHFGYVGANCSIQCQCNGHADCEGPDKLNICLECRNDTMGKQCEKCKPLFVGDPTNNGQCVPCLSHCYGHSSICMHNASELPPPLHEMSIPELEVYLGEGPSAKAKCLRCANSTDGPRCDKCIDGHFRGSEDYRDPCRPCECHGHGDVCDPVTGEKCNCGNNTESDATCQTSSSSKNSAQECWRYQCVKCKDSYMGDPKNGHQCYRMMTADNKMCFDAKLIDECKLKPKPLYPGQTVFFVVIPRFMNVDIRVVVDVTQGALDLYMSPNDSIFVIYSNLSYGAHAVELDRTYFKGNPFRLMEYTRDESEKVHRTFDVKTGYTFVDYRVKEKDLSTYITVDTKNTLLKVRDLRNRLVLTLPQHVHDLGYTKFYIVLKALSGDSKSLRPSYGMVFFRQDQLHIDLFVFFSVFFSCFFLFLAACVVAWKAKQAADVRRARRRHVVEMLHMAKRPFAGVTVVLGGGAASEVRPAAVEPTGDGRAAVATLLVRLPGGRRAPQRLALASCLALLAARAPRPPRPARSLLRRRPRAPPAPAAAPAPAAR